MQFPTFPECHCEMHPVLEGDTPCPVDALIDPFRYLPPRVEVTPRIIALADRYLSGDLGGTHYPAFQAAAFLKPKDAQQHQDRKDQFLSIQRALEADGFSVPASLATLFLTDEYIDRLHHNCVYPRLPERAIRLPADSSFAVLFFLLEGQGCAFWHLLLAPDETHTIITASDAFGCSSGYPPGREPDFATFEIHQCIDSVNESLYHYFRESARHDKEYVERLDQYFAGHPA
jgi:hypothetical protein